MRGGDGSKLKANTGIAGRGCSEAQNRRQSGRKAVLMTSQTEARAEADITSIEHAGSGGRDNKDTESTLDAGRQLRSSQPSRREETSCSNLVFSSAASARAEGQTEFATDRVCNRHRAEVQG